MARSGPEVGDIFRRRGDAVRQAHAGHQSLEQHKAMSAIEQCRARRARAALRQVCGNPACLQLLP